MKKILFFLSVFLLFSTDSYAELGSPVGYIEIPSISLFRPIYFIPLENRNYDLTELGFALGTVGHLDQTTWIHEDWGRVVLVGHTPGAFSDLPEVNIGDMILVWDTEGAVQYIVTAQHLVDVTETKWLGPTNYPSLLLMTCYGDQRWLVEAIPSNQTR